jgi:hypothetical protein
MTSQGGRIKVANMMGSGLGGSTENGIMWGPPTVGPGYGAQILMSR